MHVQYIGIGNAAGSRHNTTNPTVQRYPTALSDNGPVSWLNPLITCLCRILKPHLPEIHFLKMARMNLETEEGANLGYAIILTATQQCRIDVQHD